MIAPRLLKFKASQEKRHASVYGGFKGSKDTATLKTNGASWRGYTDLSTNTNYIKFCNTFFFFLQKQIDR